MSQAQRIATQDGYGIELNKNAINFWHDTSMDCLGAITLEFLFLPQTSTSMLGTSIFSRNDFPEACNSYDLSINSSGYLVFSVGATGITESSSYNTWTLDTKYYVAVTYSELTGLVDFYVNGDLKSSVDGSALPDMVESLNDLIIGYGSNVLATVLEARVANTIRSAAWIKATYHGFFDTLFYDFDDSLSIGDYNMPMFRVAGSASENLQGVGDYNMPLPVVTGVAVVRNGTGDYVMPHPVVTGRTGETASYTMPQFVVRGTASRVNIAECKYKMPNPVVTGVADSEISGIADYKMPPMRYRGTASHVLSVVGNCRLPLPKVKGYANTDYYATGEYTLPLPIVRGYASDGSSCDVDLGHTRD